MATIMTRVQLEILIGVILVLVTGAVLVVYGLNEEARMQEFEMAQQAQAIEVGAELFDRNCKGCHGPQGEGTPNLCPPLNDKNFFTARLDEVGWSGSLEDYIVATVSGGRLLSTRPDQYPGQGTPAMPAWSENYGGPLRDDQIRDIAAFVMNWETTAPDRSVQAAPAGPAIGTDISVELPEGDATNGEVLANAQGCVGCHVSTQTGPAWMASGDQPGIGERAAARFTQEDYTGSADTPEGYLLESIVDPAVYVVDGFQPVMPANYGESLSTQDAADLIAYLLTLK
jgi:mono/diheme cytochrome c family protein